MGVAGGCGVSVVGEGRAAGMTSLRMMTLVMALLLREGGERAVGGVAEDVFRGEAGCLTSGGVARCVVRGVARV